MKNIFLKLFISLSIHGFSLYAKGIEYIPSYHIVKSEYDKTLLKTEAVFVFHFTGDDNSAVKTPIKLSYNEQNMTEKPDENGKVIIRVKPGKYVFKFFFSTFFYEITTDSISINPAYRTDMNIHFTRSEALINMDKPVIYVYPEKTTPINIKLNLKGDLNFTYPLYNNGWNFIADPNGTIHMDDKDYNYLFWEGTSNIIEEVNWKEGFMVEKDSLICFFEEKLAQMGLNSKEIADYITYWCPLMAQNEKNYVHFLFNESVDDYAHLTINPKPDHVFRVFMIWSKIENLEQLIIKEQNIPSFIREGFSLVELGGTETSYKKTYVLSEMNNIQKH